MSGDRSGLDYVRGRSRLVFGRCPHCNGTGWETRPEDLHATQPCSRCGGRGRRAQIVRFGFEGDRGRRV